MVNNEELEKLSNQYPIILFDGDCILCSYFIQKIIHWDKKSLFKLSDLKSTALNSNTQNEIDTVVLIHKGKYFERSDVTFEIIKLLGGPWLLLYPFKWIPQIVRDGVYNIIAKNRYKWFGKKDNCALMTPDIKGRMLSLSLKESQP